ncbi:hypothetical protein P3L10_008721 [Capsicum annuum]
MHSLTRNVIGLQLLRISSVVVSCLASAVSVPVAVFLFTLPLPYLGVASSLPPSFKAGAIILVLGMHVYTWRPKVRKLIVTVNFRPLSHLREKKITTPFSNIHKNLTRDQDVHGEMCF